MILQENLNFGISCFGRSTHLGKEFFISFERFFPVYTRHESNEIFLKDLKTKILFLDSRSMNPFIERKRLIFMKNIKFELFPLGKNFFLFLEQFFIYGKVEDSKISVEINVFRFFLKFHL